MPAPAKFLFVNKTVDSKSLSNNRSSGLAYTHINRQAQLVAKNRGKKPNRKETKGTTSHPVERSETPSPKSSSSAAPPKEDEVVLSKSDDDEEEAEQIRFGDPKATFDSVCSAVAALDTTKQHVLEYFTNVWMPSKYHIPPGCQITGLTPVRPDDGEIAFHVVQGAFQANDDVSMYALLTAGSRRMQVLHTKTLPRSDFPDVYTIKAIQALRKRIQRGEPPSERLILDLSFLILAELFNPSQTRSEIYWRMIRSLIIQCGGLQCLSTFTAQIAMGFDHHISAGTFTIPALDPFTYPELLGFNLNGPRPHQESQHLVTTILDQLDGRIRLIALEAHALTELVSSIRLFPPSAVNGITSCLRSHLSQLYGVIPEPLRRSNSDGSQTAQQNPSVIVADSTYLHVRVSTWRTWVWYASLSFLPYRSRETPVPILPPEMLKKEVPPTWKAIDLIQHLLKGTGWMMRWDLLFWIAAVRYFASTGERDKREYRRLLTDIAGKLEIATSERLMEVLAGHYPLTLMHPAAERKLWDALQDALQDSKG